MADVERKTKRYPTDLTDAEWAAIQPLLPKAPNRGRKPGVDMREVLNAIRCMARSGGGWRMLPIHFGPWQTIYWWVRRFIRRLLFWSGPHQTGQAAWLADCRAMNSRGERMRKPEWGWMVL
jgi:putative transposase